MSGEHLERVRGKLDEITSYIEDADERKLTYKNDTIQVNSRNDKLETDLGTQKRRILMVHDELRHTNERLADVEEKLAKVTVEYDELKKEKNELESEEAEREESIENLEESIKEIKIKLELNASRLVESERREGVCNSEVAKISERADTSEARVKVLEDQIQGYGQNLSDLEEREGAAGERESLNEEKVAFLEGELKDTILRYEAAERISAVLYNSNMEVNDEINSVVQRRQDMLSNMGLMDDVADDPSYKCFDIGGEDEGMGSGRSTPASIFGAKSELSFKAKEGSRSGSRVGGSRAETPIDKPPAAAPELTATPSPEPVASPEPAEEEEEEEEDEEDDDEEEEEEDKEEEIDDEEEEDSEEESESEED